jgi:mRNA interferase MazF
MGMVVKQYEIYYVDLVISENLRVSGAEIRKSRPCVVISPDEMNRHLRTVVVAPVTSRSRLLPTRVRVRHNEKTGWIVVDQIRTVDRKRVLRRLDKLTHPEIRKLKAVIRETYVE